MSGDLYRTPGESRRAYDARMRAANDPTGKPGLDPAMPLADNDSFEVVNDSFDLRRPRAALPTNLTGKRVAIFGPQGSGKSVLAGEIARAFPSARIACSDASDWESLPNTHVIDVMPRSAVGDEGRARKWIERVARKATINPERAAVDLWVIDEASQFLPSRKPMPEVVSWINNTARHMRLPSGRKGLAWLVIARRPAQVHTDLLELAHEAIFFRLTGRNDLRLVEEMQEGLSDVVRGLPPFHFIRRSASGDVSIHSPVTLPAGR